MERGTRQATVQRVVKELDMTEHARSLTLIMLIQNKVWSLLSLTTIFGRWLGEEFCLCFFEEEGFSESVLSERRLSIPRTSGQLW